MRGSLAAAGLLVVVGLLAFGTSAFAKGPPVVKQIDREVNETSTNLDVHPCTGVPVELTLVESGKIHFSFFADGTVHITGTLRGTFSADVLPVDGVPDATGTFTTWFGGNGLLLEEGGASGKGEAGFTLNGRGVNADGSTFRSTRTATPSSTRTGYRSSTSPRRAAASQADNDVQPGRQTPGWTRGWFGLNAMARCAGRRGWRGRRSDA